MAKKRVCPYCFEEFDATEVLFRCINSRCTGYDNDPVLAEFWGDAQRKAAPFFEGNKKKSFLGLFGNAIPDNGTCPSCGQHSSYTICPKCHNCIPKEMVDKRGYIISIIGARSSGKTNYITVLIDQMKKELHKLGGLHILPSATADLPKYRTSVRYMEDFYNTLYRNKTCPAQTQIGDEKSRVPLIYRLTCPAENVDPIFLVFYDTAGENFNDGQTVRNNVKFLDHSDAYIFLMDTFQIPAVKEKLHIPDSPGDQNYDKILETVVEVLNTPTEGKVTYTKKPMAVTFSKIDAIIANPEAFPEETIPNLKMESDSIFLNEEGMKLSEIDSVHDGIKKALSKKWNEAGFAGNFDTIYKGDNADNYRFFGISALGQKPNADNEVDEIRPYRVLDPLVWILYKLGYPLKINKEK